MYSKIERKVNEKFPQFVHPFLKDVFKRRTYLKRKILNFKINQLEQKWSRASLVSYPYYLVIDPTNICNLKCPLCPTWQDTKARTKGKMDTRTFNSLLDEAGPYVFAVNLCNWGEPFLNPELPAMIAHAKKYNTVVGLSTNLNYLPDETAKILIESGIDIIVISLDGASQESYSTYRVGGDLAKVTGNIEKLTSYRKNMKSPLIIWQFLVNRYNELEIDVASSMAREMGLVFFPSPMRTSMGKELLSPLYERVKEMKDWLPRNPAYNRYAYEIKPETRTPQKTCKWLWNATVVNWDGSVSPCCGVFEKTWDFGTCCSNAGEKRLTLRQAWNSPRYKLARRLISAYMRQSQELGPLEKRARKEGIICSKCVRYGFLED